MIKKMNKIFENLQGWSKLCELLVIKLVLWIAIRHVLKTIYTTGG